MPMRRPPHHHNGPHHHHRGPHAGWGEHDQLRGRNQLYWEDSITTAHNPYEDVVDSPGLVHAWEKHHVLSWLNTVGLGDVIASFKSQKIKGEDLIKLTPKNAADHLKLKDQTTVMRVLERVMPLKEEWKAARQAAGLKTGPSLFASYVPEPERPKRLIAELHVLIHGLTALPPGAAGSYVCLELGDHVAKSSFVPSAAYEQMYYEDRHGAMYACGGPNWPSSTASFVHRPTEGGYSLWPAEEAGENGAWPQTFKLTIDEDIAKDKDKKYGKIVVDVVAWFPQVGELSLGTIEVPVPKKKDASCRVKFEAPVKAELHWKGFGCVGKRDEDAWEKEEEPVVVPPGGLTQQHMPPQQHGFGGAPWGGPMPAWGGW